MFPNPQRRLAYQAAWHLIRFKLLMQPMPQIQRRVAMLSLDNTYSEDEGREFLRMKTSDIIPLYL